MYALYKSRTDESMQVLIDALRDPNTAESAVRALRIRRDVRARAELAVLANAAPRADLRRRANAAGAAIATQQVSASVAHQPYQQAVVNGPQA